MTITNRNATAAYLHALNDMQGTKPGMLARMADRMAGHVFDRKQLDTNIKPISQDAMMDIETALFVGLCDANQVDWRMVAA
jgi:hypothetical protein